MYDVEFGYTEVRRNREQRFAFKTMEKKINLLVGNILFWIVLILSFYYNIRIIYTTIILLVGTFLISLISIFTAGVFWEEKKFILGLTIGWFFSFIFCLIGFLLHLLILIVVGVIIFVTILIDYIYYRFVVPLEIYDIAVVAVPFSILIIYPIPLNEINSNTLQILYSTLLQVYLTLLVVIFMFATFIIEQRKRSKSTFLFRRALLGITVLFILNLLIVLIGLLTTKQTVPLNFSYDNLFFISEHMSNQALFSIIVFTTTISLFISSLFYIYVLFKIIMKEKRGWRKAKY